jgi:lipopolysaccharide transport system permease protein
MPLSIVVSNLVKFTIQFILFLAFIAYYLINNADFSPNIYILLFPALLVIMAAQGLGLGMIISAMTTKYRDLAFLLTFGVQLLMFVTPVIYPLSEAYKKFPEHSWIIEYNPMSAVIETFRYAFLGTGTFNSGLLGYSAGVTLVLLLIGIVIFNKVEKNFVDTV